MTGTGKYSNSGVGVPPASGSAHIPVLLKEVLSGLDVKPGRTYVDCTFGAGGYSRAILEAAPDVRVIGIDRDERAIASGRETEQQYQGRLRLVHGRFSDIADILHSLGIEKVAGIVCDLGVSSMQIDTAERGFSFMRDGELNMQMGSAALTAQEVVNSYAEDVLADIIYNFGEEKASRRIARAIVQARRSQAITSTKQLADIIAKVVHSGPINPATRTFQALRIYVNDELGELEKVLDASLGLLEGGGRLAVVSFHSLEDRIIKRFFNKYSGKVFNNSRYLPALLSVSPKLLRVLNGRPVTASAEELEANSRSRSAKLRVAEREAAA